MIYHITIGKDNFFLHLFVLASNVYLFQVFTPKFCEDFIEEINNFENSDLPKGRPNTMNNYGVRYKS